MFNQENEITSFAFNLYRCAIAFRNELNRELSQVFGDDFSSDFWFILSVLWDEDNISHGQLAEKVSRDKASLSRTLDIMEEKGFVKRISAADDKRGSKIVLTKKSIEIKEKALNVVNEFTNCELKGLSPIEVKELARMLNLIFSNIKG